MACKIYICYNACVTEHVKKVYVSANSINIVI